jgi:hypothetical protein
MRDRHGEHDSVVNKNYRARRGLEKAHLAVHWVLVDLPVACVHNSTIRTAEDGTEAVRDGVRHTQRLDLERPRHESATSNRVSQRGSSGAALRAKGRRSQAAQPSASVTRLLVVYDWRGGFALSLLVGQRVGGAEVTQTLNKIWGEGGGHTCRRG